MGSVDDMLNRSNGLSTNIHSVEANTNTEPVDEHVELVHNCLDIFRGTTPDSLKSSIQYFEEGMKRDIEVQRRCGGSRTSTIQRWIRGESGNIVGRLNRRIRRMGVVVEVMKGLLEDVEDRGQSQELKVMK